MNGTKKQVDVIGIIAPANKKYVPYIQYYIDIFTANNTPYKIISWDKCGLEEPGVDFAFRFKVNDSNRKRMLWGYLLFARACKKYIKKNGIKKLVVLTVAPAIFLGKNYLKHFKQKYILDIRDDSPFFKVFPDKINQIAANAQNVVVSSNKFRNWIKREAVLCHNVDINQINKYIDLPSKNSAAFPLSIVFAGMMIEGLINIKILESFKGDDRFVFHYIGRPNNQKEDIVSYASNSGMKNVFFEGAYNKEDIVDIYRSKADLVNILRDKTVVNKNALPNKLYDAVVSKVPVVVFEHNEAIVEYVKKYNLGLILKDGIEDVNNIIWNEMKTFDYEKFNIGCVAFLNQILNDMALYQQTVLDFIDQ